MDKPTRKLDRRKGVTTENLFKLRIPTSISLSPDENKIAFTVERIDKDENKYSAHIFVYDLSSREQRQFTHGNNHDSQVVWSPDGRQLAFVSVRDKKVGIYTMPAAGGAEKKAVELDGSIANLQWTPDGKALVFGLRYNDSHYVKDEKKKKEAPVYRHITKLLYRFDGTGFLPKDKFQVYALGLENGKLRKITSGKRDNHSPCVSADGRWVAFVSNRHPDPYMEYLRDDLFVIPFKGGRERKVATPEGPIACPKFSPDGRHIAYIGHDKPRDTGVANQHVWKVSSDGKKKARDLMPGFDRMVVDLSITDTSDAHFTSPIEWSADGKRIFFQASDTGCTNLYYLPAASGKPTAVFKGKCHIKGYSLSGRSRVVALIYADVHNPAEIYSCPTVYGGEKKALRHTDLNRFLRTDVKLGRTRDVMFRSFDGTEVQGWLILPPDFRPGKKYPSILEIHGGPRVQYAHSFFHEMQYLAANGYVVFYTNPRGGQGRGETWADAISGGWGDLDYRDCMAAADWLEKQSFVDRKRMGVTGGSYGGYMTNWIIGHTNRFKAAVTQRSVVNLESMFGASDVGFDLEREFNGFPWTNRENYDKCSPITYFEKVRTPILILHNENDLRCGIEQAEQMFAKLKVLKKTVEMVRFPEEPHGLSRHGRPDRRIARLEWILKWFNRYLKR